MATGHPEVPEDEQKSAFLEHVSERVHVEDEKMEEHVGKKDRVRLDEGLGNGWENQREGTEVLLLQELEGVCARHVHGRTVPGEKGSEGGGEREGCVLLLQLLVEGSEGVLNHEGEQGG